MGDVALSCNPSYLGGQSNGMTRGAEASQGKQMEFQVRIKAVNAGWC
jgi:hypothetical protein